uniref:tryptase alpha/beta-1-like n=1 Tax=Monopterus albus TaxID=43700 RepID=UPI0009B363D4|nr:tryptase alpha/beta-1-like [Monopterus albus]
MDGTHEERGAHRKKKTQKALMHLRIETGFLPAVSFIIGTVVGSGIFTAPKGVLMNSSSVGLSLLVWKPERRHHCSLCFIVCLSAVCGQAVLNTRIVGGQSAPPGSWPWQVGLVRNGSFFCGGSLINRKWVMTAAQCLPRCMDVPLLTTVLLLHVFPLFVSPFYLSNDTSNLLVLMGRQSLATSSPSEVFRTVTQIINHPNFNPATLDNDIALVRLSSPVNFTTHVLPICLAASDSTFYNGTDAWVTGWGNVGSGVAPPVPYDLREVDVPVVGNRQCNCDYGVGTITDNMMCAGSPAGGKGTCQILSLKGDGGGPLVSKQGGRWIQGGIVSFGIGCSLPNFPGVYTRVSQYQSWISSQVSSDQPGFVTFMSGGTDGDLNVTCPSLPPPVALPPLPAATLCGQAGYNTRIVGGQSAAPGSWPWQIGVFKNGFLLCGGSLITSEWFVTAAQCFPR